MRRWRSLMPNGAKSGGENPAAVRLHGMLAEPGAEGTPRPSSRTTHVRFAKEAQVRTIDASQMKYLDELTPGVPSSRRRCSDIEEVEECPLAASRWS